MAKEAGMSFEVPAEMKMIAEKTMEQAREAFDSFMNATKEAVSQAETRATTARSGAKDVVELAVKFSEQNIAASFEFALRLMQAKDAKDVTAIHSEYVSKQVSALTEQAKELSKHTAKLTGGVH
jgi:phasin